MTILDERLVTACAHLGGVATEVQAWIDANAAFVGTERISLLHEFHRAESEARRLAAAVPRRPLVAFVGPQRSVKTQTIAGLVGRGSDRMRLRFDGINEPVDLLRHVLPESGRQVSAMVVRLTEGAAPAPQNFPLLLRLLSVADIVKVLANAHLTVSTAEPPALADIKDAVDFAAARAIEAPVAGLDEDDVWDIRTYLTTRFPEHPTVRILTASGYWLALAAHVGHLSNADRADLLGLLWGADRMLGTTFTALAEATAKLTGSRSVHCALNAVLSLDPRSGRFQRAPDNIIAGAALTGFHVASPDMIVVRTENDVWVSIDRRQLAALTAEITLPVPQGTSQLLEQADVAEFPSISGRATAGDFAARLTSQPSYLPEVFLAAKAAYLFDRATAQHEITGLVVCAEYATRSLGELDALIARWVDATLGASPASREGGDNALFFALTKVDKAFADVKSREPGSGIGDRIEALLEGGLGRDHAWPREWTPGEPFANVHLLRNPNFRAKQLCNYSTDGRETGFKTTQVERIERAHRAFLRSAPVGRHITDPAAVWSEAMLLNDGGLTYLAQSIGAACGRRVHQRQLAHALKAVTDRMRDRLQRYHLTDNFEHQNNGRHAHALAVVRRLRKCDAERRFGQLLGALQITDSEIADVLHGLGGMPAGDINGHAVINGGGLNGSATDDGSGGANAGMNGHGVEHEVNGHAGGEARPALLARLAVDHWIESVRKVAASALADRRFKMDRQSLAHLTDELIAGASRLEIEQRIAAEIERHGARAGDLEQQIAIAAMFAANALSDYVMRLGANDIFSNNHPRRRGHAGQPIFPPRTPVFLASLDEAIENPARELYADWSQAYLALVQENISSLRERAPIGEQNDRLGRLIKLLDITL